MPAVLLHGVPETPVVWDSLRSHLDRRDVITPRLPGFGVPTPAGFGATKEEYVDWLVGELEAIGEPVDLVGHDWGGGFVLRVACTRPDLIRTWASDVAGLLDPAYEWHQLATVWQTPGAGEEYFAAVHGLPLADRVQAYEGAGITPEAARAFAEAADETMGRCILALYRSASREALDKWAKDAEAAAARPGLVVVPEADSFVGGTELPLRMAVRLGARSEVLEGRGHWWMLEDPARGAQALQDFWAKAG
jgi:pimeloyl-ACP methyl ester carboxylesterase